MASLLKKLFQGFKIAILMVLGFSIYVLLFMFVLGVIVSGLGWLFVGTAESPYIFIPIDILLGALFIYLVTRPSFKFRLRELWNQIWLNL